HGVTVRREKLRIETELTSVLRLRPAVWPKQRGRFGSGSWRIERIHDEAVDFRAVRALEFRFVDVREPEILHERFALLREITEIIFLDGEDFVGAIGRARAHDGFPIPAHVV